MSGSRCFFANHSSINAPWAPQSISALVLTICLPSIILVLTVIDFESLFGILQILKALMEGSWEGLVIIASLHTKNPLLLRPLLLDHCPEDL